MSLKDLSVADFEALKAWDVDMLKCHEAEFVKYINPSLMRAMYRGRTKYEIHEKSVYGDIGNSEEEWKKHLTAMTTLFQATNTIVTNLYYQNPSPIITPLRNSDADSAALMTASIKHFMKLNKSKQQNQEAVLNSWFFGFGVKKLGWRATFEPRFTAAQEPESQSTPEMEGKRGLMANVMQGLQGMLGMGKTYKPDSLESKETPDIPDFETLYNNSENPMNIAFDNKTDMLNGRSILHSLPRTLHDLETYGDYDEEVLGELFEHMQNKEGTRFDTRKTEVKLREKHVIQRNGIWVLSYVDEFKKPLRYERLDWGGTGMLFEILSLTFEPGVRYPTSHMKVASQIQSKLDDATSMFVELIARSIDLVCVNEKALSAGQASALKQNLLRGLLQFKEPIGPGAIQRFNTGSVSNDLPNLIALLGQKINEVVGGDSQLLQGSSKNDTLGQDELARVGTKLRESGLKDRVHDWMNSQLRKEGQLIKQFSNSEIHLQITGKDYTNRKTGEKVEDKWVSFMTPENPLGLKHYLQGEFDYDCNIEEATQPDRKSQRAALIELITLQSNPMVQDANLRANFMFDLGKANEDLIMTYDGVLNPKMYIQPLDSMQKAAIQVQQLLTQNPQMASPQPLNPKGKESTDMGVTNGSSVVANGE